ncbi:MAG: helicase [Gammaproteobacteria bacterium]|nr:MAG: helicase [Gammaproteobacteria bacterium]
MKFWFMLWVLGLRMWWLARNNEDFQRNLSGQDIILQFQTHDGKIARHYVIKNERVHAFGGQHLQPSLVLSFKDAAFAADTISKAGKDPSIFMKGMQSQDIKATGNLGLMMWFMGLVKYLKPQKKNKAT